MGLSHFLHGITEGVSDVAGNIVGATENVAKAGAFAVTHVPQAAEGAWKASKFIGEHTGEIAKFAGEHAGEAVAGTVKGTAFLATHPQYWDDAAKQMLKDQLKPQNLAITAGLVLATVATGGIAGVGLGAKAAEVTAEVGETGAAMSTAIKGAKVAEEAADVGQTLNKGQKIVRGVKQVGTDIREARGVEKLDKLATASKDIKSAVREGLGMHPETYIQRGRTLMAEKMLPGVMERGAAAGAGEVAEKSLLQTGREGVEKSLFRKIEGGPGLARPEAQSTWSNAQTRLGSIQNQTLGRVNQARGVYANVQAAGEVTKAIANPEEAVQHLGKAAFEHYKPQIENIALKHGAKAIKNKLFGGGEDGKEKAAQPYQPYQQAAPAEQPALMDFRLDGTRSTRTSKRIAGQPAALGTVTKNSTMPSQVGPSNWYGPQQGYAPGRGFVKSQPATGALPPLEQPQQRQSDMLGV